MVYEIAFLPIADGKGKEFEAAFGRALEDVFPKAQGFLRGQVCPGVERPDVYVILIEWETLEDHTERFEKSDLYKEFLGLIGSFVAGKPVVEHWRSLAA